MKKIEKWLENDVPESVSVIHDTRKQNSNKNREVLESDEKISVEDTIRRQTSNRKKTSDNSEPRLLKTSPNQLLMNSKDMVFIHLHSSC